MLPMKTMYINISKGGGGGLVWSATLQYCPASFYLSVFIGKDRGKHRWGFLPWRISHKIVIHKTQSMPEAKHLLLRDVPTLPLDKSCWQGWLSRGHISLDARISPQLSFNSMADFNQGLLITLKCHKQPTFAIVFLDCYQNLSDIIHTMQKID